MKATASTSNSKYRLSVLLDLSGTPEATMTSAAQLAKAIDGSVEALYVKTPTDVVKYENQLSAMRTINEDRRNSKAKIQELVEKISQREGIPISVQMTYGNVKNKVKDYVADRNPDILVIGKRKSRLINSLKGGVHVLITDKRHTFHSLKDISVGVFDDLQGTDFEIIDDLQKDTTRPLRMFSIKSNKPENTKKMKLQNTVSYVFSEGTNALDGIVSYVARTNTQLFCVPKTHGNKTKEILKKLDVPILIMS